MTSESDKAKPAPSSSDGAGDGSEAAEQSAAQAEPRKDQPKDSAAKAKAAKSSTAKPEATAPKSVAATATMTKTETPKPSPADIEPDVDMVDDPAALRKEREQLRDLSSAYAQKSLDRMIWLNAVAIGALLPIGELLGATFADPVVVAYFLLAGGFFGLGVVVAILATMFGYFSMDRYRKAIGHKIRFNSAARAKADQGRDQHAYKRFRNKGSRNTRISVWFTLLSGISFVFGAAVLFCWKLGFEVIPESWIARLAT